jgi:hypothetical protein
MDKPGRNDPCYCGSGKKYKQCHMPADLAAEREQRAWLDASRELRLMLVEYADDEPLAELLGEAATRYWDNYYSADTLPLMSQSESERFLDWFIFDYTLPSGSRPVEDFRSTNRSNLNTTQSRLLDQWIEAGPMSAYELTGYDRQILHLKEILSSEELDVFEPAGHGNAPIGSWILGRVIPVDDRLEFFALPAYIPPEEIGDLPARLDNAQSTFEGTTADFMRRHNVLLVHHALEQAKKAGRPPVSRLDPHHTPEGVPHRARHDRVRIKGPATLPGENVPPMTQTRRKAI